MAKDLNDTLMFVKVVETGSFTAAAQALAVPKTTISRRLRELEERLGARRLNRTTRQLAVTEAGAVYFEHCKQLYEDLEAAANAVQQLQGAPRGWLRVTAPYSLSVAMLAPILRDFRERCPDVRVEVILSNDRLDLVADKIDVALRVGDLPDSGLIARRLATWPTHVFAAESYLARHGEPLEPDELVLHRVLTLPRHRRNGGFAWPLSDGDRSVEAPVEPVVVANDPEMLLPLLASGEGLMLTAPPLVQCCPEMLRGTRRVLGAWSGPDVDLNAVFIGGLMSPKVRAFVDFVSESFARWNAGDCGGEDVRAAS
jgi:DNA-binding transcriptional LysR family regulator